MRKVYLEGPLGQKFGEEFTLNVNSPAEALTAIMVQRPGMRQFITESEGIQGYDVLIDDSPIERFDELVLNDPGMSQSYTFVPVIAGSKNSGLMMILGVALIAATGGFAAFGMTGMMGSSAVTVGSAAGAQAGAINAAMGLAAGSAGAVTASTTVTAAMSVALQTASMAGTAAGFAVSGAGMLGMGLLLGGAAMMLAPDVPDESGAETAENYLFSGPVNTVKQGEPIPLIYGRAITGSKTISASLFTNTSSRKMNSNGRNMVGISDFRVDGTKTKDKTGITQGYSWRTREDYDNGGCPDPSMLIHLVGGERKLAGDLEVGDLIYTQHEHSLEWGEYAISYVEVLPNTEKLKLIFEDNTFICSTTHEFYVEGKEWIKIKDMEIGDVVSGNKLIAIEEESPGDVVKITVDEAHTYIVNGLLSHNK